MTTTDPIASDRSALLALAEKWEHEADLIDNANVAAAVRELATELRAFSGAWKGLALFFRTRAAQVHDELEYMRNWVTPSVGIVRQCADNLKEPIAHFDRLNAEETKL